MTNTNTDECIFCKIVRGEIPSVKIWEDEDYLAILDLYPNTEGMALVMTKKHFDSYVFDMPKFDYKRYMSAVKKVAKLLEKGLGVQRVAMVMEGMGVNHAHVKLYPLHGLGEKFRVMDYEKEIYFDKYEGYITSQSGPKKSTAELEKVAKKIRERA